MRACTNKLEEEGKIETHENVPDEDGEACDDIEMELTDEFGECNEVAVIAVRLWRRLSR